MLNCEPLQAASENPRTIITSSMMDLVISSIGNMLKNSLNTSTLWHLTWNIPLNIPVLKESYHFLILSFTLTPAPPSTGSRRTPISTPTTPRLPPCPLRSLSSAPSPVVRTSCTPPTSRQGTPTS